MDLYEKNLEALRSKNWTLAERIQHEADDANITLQATENQAPTLYVHGGEKIQALHHPTDPFKNSQEFLASLEGVHENRNIALLGCGLGYIPLIIQQTHPGLQHFYIFEPSITAFRIAMDTVDLTPILLADSTSIIVGADPAVIYGILTQNLMDLMANPLFIIEIPSFTHTFPDWANLVKTQIQENLRFGQSGLLTKFKDGPRCLSNLFGNLPAFTNARGLSTIGDSLKDRPAIIVAAGPSLANNLEQLKPCEDRFVIIATDTVHKTLLSHGITPHFVVTVDPTELNLSHFPDESYSDESVLIFDPESRAEIPLKFKHRMTYITNKHPFFDWLETQVGQKGKIAKGGMVSHTAFHIAQYFGCSPIIFIGLDLALNPSDGGTHIQNTAVYRNVHYLDDDPTHVEVPYPHMENKTFREPLFWVDGIKGEKVPTIQSFLIYIRMLEEDIRKTQTPVIDATEGGAKIEGTQIKPLSEVMQMEGKGGAAITTTLQPIFQEPEAPVSHDPQACRHTIRELLRDKVERAQSGLHKMDEYSNMELSEIQKVIETNRQNIISDEVSEYCIEYAAPRELFRFLQLGPANADVEKKKEIALQRLKALFDATLQANDVLVKDLK